MIKANVNMKKIDVKTWNRKSAYNWFSTFSNPCYGFDVTMDITKLYNLTKKTNTSFFINMLYIVSYALNQIEEMRLRIVNGEVVLHDIINPAYVVMTKVGVFENCYNKMDYNYHSFYEKAHMVIENAKSQEKVKDEYNDDNTYNEFYITCIPWLEYDCMSHPLPSDNPSSSSVPRICWNKYHLHEDGKVTIKLNITVNHSLVDGYPLSKSFLKVQEILDNVDEYIK